jgi:aminopeptidase N
MKKMFLLSCILAFALPACRLASGPVKGAAGIGDPFYPNLGNGGYDVQNYALILSIDPATNQINGSTTIEAKSTENLSAFDLDFTGLAVDSVSVDASPAAYSRSGDELAITPSKTLRAGENFTVVVAYQGQPGGIPGVTSPVFLQAIGWTRAGNGAINVLSEPNGASGWFPSNNHPRDKASFRFEITVPKPWMVAANGTLTQALDQGNETKFIWVMDEPMATYLASINVDRFTVRTLDGPHGIPIKNYFPPGYPDSDASNFDKLPEMLAFLETVYGPYPFDEYGVVVADLENPMCQTTGTAIETQTLSVHCPSPSMASEEAIVHELAHQWFGDSVSLENWRDIWLKEGMATYAQWLWLTREDGLERLTTVVKAQKFGGKLASPVAQPPASDLYRDESYRGGGLVFHALRLKVGEEAFFKILRTYLDRYKYGNAGTEEFIAVAEEVSGQNLISFFDSWLYSTDLPELQ